MMSVLIALAPTALAAPDRLELQCSDRLLRLFTKSPHAKTWSHADILREYIQTASVSIEPVQWKEETTGAVWGVAVTDAVRSFIELAGWQPDPDGVILGPCDPDTLAETDIYADIFRDPDVKAAIERYGQKNKIQSPVMSQVFGQPYGASAPQPLQLAVSQATVGDLSGFAPGIKGSPAANANSWEARHWSLAVSGLLLQGPPDDTHPTPYTIPASIEGFTSWTTIRTPYDWHDELTKEILESDLYRQNQATALSQSIKLYRGWNAQYLNRTAPSFEAAAEDTNLFQVLEALRGGQAVFERLMIDYYTRKIESTEQAYSNRVEYTGDINARLTAADVYAPDVSDLFHVGTKHQVAIHVAGKDAASYGLDLLLTGELAYSRFPTTPGLDGTAQYSRVDWSADGAPRLQVDVNLGADILVPGSPYGSFHLTLLASGRMASEKRPDGESDANGGVSGSLTMPISDGMSLIGGYSVRCELASVEPCTSTSVFTFAAGIDRRL